MYVEFHHYDASQKRWFTKVAKRAAGRVSAIVSEFDYQMPDTWSAEFAVKELTRTRIHRIRDRHQTILSVTFAAASWQSLDSSADDAIAQLASAVLCVVPQDLAVQLRGAFIANGVSQLRPISMTSEVAPPDSNHHVELCIRSQGIGLDEFYSLYDRLDAHLRDQRLGFVNGSSWSVDSYCIDFSLPIREAGIRCVMGFITEQGHRDRVTLSDISTGESLEG